MEISPVSKPTASNRLTGVRFVIPSKRRDIPYLVAPREQKATAVAASVNFKVASVGQ